MKSKILFAVAGLALLVTSCASAPVNECAIFNPIIPTVADVDVLSNQLVIDLEVHNQVYDAICR